MTVRVLREEHSWICRLADLRQTSSTVLSSLSSNSRKQIERCAKLYEERGEVALHTPTGDDQWSVSWQRLETLHAATWEARGGASVFANPDLLAFHKRLRKDHPESVALVELRAGEETVGVLYNFVHEGRVMNYQSGFQYEEDNRLKPGLLTHVMAAQHYLDNGLDTYDMLVGDVRYKQSLGEAGERMSLVEAVRPGWRQTAVSLARSLRYRIRHRS
nr:GNAT family N-acetyltransferase [Aquisalinus flavus]